MRDQLYILIPGHGWIAGTACDAALAYSDSDAEGVLKEEWVVFMGELPSSEKVVRFPLGLFVDLIRVCILHGYRKPDLGVTELAPELVQWIFDQIP